MKAIITASAPDQLDALVRLWEASVRSTHHFVSEEDILSLRPLVRDRYLPGVELYVIRDGGGETVGFVGLSDEVIEMLFIHPDRQGKGYGSALLDFAVREMKRYKIDVNEQNEKAFRFYVKKGFRVFGRDEFDPQGRPFPILHLEWQHTDEFA